MNNISNVKKKFFERYDLIKMITQINVLKEENKVKKNHFYVKEKKPKFYQIKTELKNEISKEIKKANKSNDKKNYKSKFKIKNLVAQIKSTNVLNKQKVENKEEIKIDNWKININKFPWYLFDIKNIHNINLKEYCKNNTNALSLWQDSDFKFKWRKCQIVDYLENENLFLIQWDNSNLVKKVSSLNIVLNLENIQDLEDRRDNAKKLKEIFIKKLNFENYAKNEGTNLLNNIYFSIESFVRIMKNSIENLDDLNNPNIEESINEMLIDYLNCIIRFKIENLQVNTSINFMNNLKLEIEVEKEKKIKKYKKYIIMSHHGELIGELKDIGNFDQIRYNLKNKNDDINNKELLINFYSKFLDKQTESDKNYFNKFKLVTIPKLEIVKINKFEELYFYIKLSSKFALKNIEKLRIYSEQVNYQIINFYTFKEETTFKSLREKINNKYKLNRKIKCFVNKLTYDFQKLSTMNFYESYLKNWVYSNKILQNYVELDKVMSYIKDIKFILHIKGKNVIYNLMPNKHVFENLVGDDKKLIKLADYIFKDKLIECIDFSMNKLLSYLRDILINIPIFIINEDFLFMMNNYWIKEWYISLREKKIHYNSSSRIFNKNLIKIKFNKNENLFSDINIDFIRSFIKLIINEKNINKEIFINSHINFQPLLVFSIKIKKSNLKKKNIDEKNFKEIFEKFYKIFKNQNEDLDKYLIKEIYAFLKKLQYKNKGNFFCNFNNIDEDFAYLLNNEKYPDIPGFFSSIFKSNFLEIDPPFFDSISYIHKLILLPLIEIENIKGYCGNNLLNSSIFNKNIKNTSHLFFSLLNISYTSLISIFFSLKFLENILLISNSKCDIKFECFSKINEVFDYLEKIKKIQVFINSFPEEINFSCIKIDIKEFKDILNYKIDQYFLVYNNNIEKYYNFLINNIKTTYKEIEDKILMKNYLLDSFIVLSKYLSSLDYKNKIIIIENNLEKINNLLKYQYFFNLKFNEENYQDYINCKIILIKNEKQIEIYYDKLNKRKDIFKLELNIKSDKIFKDLKNLKHNINDFNKYKEKDRSEFYFKKASSIFNELNNLLSLSKQLNEKERIFEFNITNFKEIDSLITKIEKFYLLWEFIDAKWNKNIKVWVNKPFYKLKINEMEDIINYGEDLMKKLLYHFDKDIDLKKICIDLSLEIFNFKILKKFVIKLKHPAWKEHHWNQLFTILDSFNPSPESNELIKIEKITLGYLISKNIKSKENEIERILNRALKEKEIEIKINKTDDSLMILKFNFEKIKYEKKHLIIINNINKLIDKLEFNEYIYETMLRTIELNDIYYQKIFAKKEIVIKIKIFLKATLVIQIFILKFIYIFKYKEEYKNWINTKFREEFFDIVNDFKFLISNFEYKGIKYLINNYSKSTDKKLENDIIIEKLNNKYNIIQSSINLFFQKIRNKRNKFYFVSNHQLEILLSMVDNKLSFLELFKNIYGYIQNFDYKINENSGVNYISISGYKFFNNEEIVFIQPITVEFKSSSKMPIIKLDEELEKANKYYFENKLHNTLINIKKYDYDFVEIFKFYAKSNIIFNILEISIEVIFYSDVTMLLNTDNKFKNKIFNKFIHILNYNLKVFLKYKYVNILHNDKVISLSSEKYIILWKKLIINLENIIKIENFNFNNFEYLIIPKYSLHLNLNENLKINLDENKTAKSKDEIVKNFNKVKNNTKKQINTILNNYNKITDKFYKTKNSNNYNYDMLIKKEIHTIKCDMFPCLFNKSELFNLILKNSYNLKMLIMNFEMQHSNNVVNKEEIDIILPKFNHYFITIILSLNNFTPLLVYSYNLINKKNIIKNIGLTLGRDIYYCGDEEKINKNLLWNYLKGCICSGSWLIYENFDLVPDKHKKIIGDFIMQVSKEINKKSDNITIENENLNINKNFGLFCLLNSFKNYKSISLNILNNFRVMSIKSINNSQIIEILIFVILMDNKKCKKFTYKFVLFYKYIKNFVNSWKSILVYNFAEDNSLNFNFEFLVKILKISIKEFIQDKQFSEINYWNFILYFKEKLSNTIFHNIISNYNYEMYINIFDQIFLKKKYINKENKEIIDFKKNLKISKDNKIIYKELYNFENNIKFLLNSEHYYLKYLNIDRTDKSIDFYEYYNNISEELRKKLKIFILKEDLDFKNIQFFKANKYENKQIFHINSLHSLNSLVDINIENTFINNFKEITKNKKNFHSDKIKNILKDELKKKFSKLNIHDFINYIDKFTNNMQIIIYGDTNNGKSKLIQFISNIYSILIQEVFKLFWINIDVLDEEFLLEGNKEFIGLLKTLYIEIYSNFNLNLDHINNKKINFKYTYSNEFNPKNHKINNFLNWIIFDCNSIKKNKFDFIKKILQHFKNNSVLNLLRNNQSYKTNYKVIYEMEKMYNFEPGLINEIDIIHIKSNLSTNKLYIKNYINKLVDIDSFYRINQIVIDNIFYLIINPFIKILYNLSKTTFNLVYNKRQLLNIFISNFEIFLNEYRKLYIYNSDKFNHLQKEKHKYDNLKQKSVIAKFINKNKTRSRTNRFKSTNKKDKNESDINESYKNINNNIEATALFTIIQFLFPLINFEKKKILSENLIKICTKYCKILECNNKLFAFNFIENLKLFQNDYILLNFNFKISKWEHFKDFKNNENKYIQKSLYCKSNLERESINSNINNLFAYDKYIKYQYIQLNDRLLVITPNIVRIMYLLELSIFYNRFVFYISNRQQGKSLVLKHISNSIVKNSEFNIYNYNSNTSYYKDIKKFQNLLENNFFYLNQNTLSPNENYQMLVIVEDLNLDKDNKSLSLFRSIVTQDGWYSYKNKGFLNIKNMNFILTYSSNFNIFREVKKINKHLNNKLTFIYQNDYDFNQIESIFNEINKNLIDFNYQYDFYFIIYTQILTTFYKNYDKLNIYNKDKIIKYDYNNLIQIFSKINLFNNNNFEKESDKFTFICYMFYHSYLYELNNNKNIFLKRYDYIETCWNKKIVEESLSYSSDESDVISEYSIKNKSIKYLKNLINENFEENTKIKKKNSIDYNINKSMRDFKINLSKKITSKEVLINPKDENFSLKIMEIMLNIKQYKIENEFSKFANLQTFIIDLQILNRNSSITELNFDTPISFIPDIKIYNRNQVYSLFNYFKKLTDNFIIKNPSSSYYLQLNKINYINFINDFNIYYFDLLKENNSIEQKHIIIVNNDILFSKYLIKFISHFLNYKFININIKDYYNYSKNKFYTPIEKLQKKLIKYSKVIWNGFKIIIFINIENNIIFENKQFKEWIEFINCYCNKENSYINKLNKLVKVLIKKFKSKNEFDDYKENILLEIIKDKIDNSFIFVINSILINKGIDPAKKANNYIRTSNFLNIFEKDYFYLSKFFNTHLNINNSFINFEDYNLDLNINLNEGFDITKLDNYKLIIKYSRFEITLLNNFDNYFENSNFINNLYRNILYIEKLKIIIYKKLNIGENINKFKDGTINDISNLLGEKIIYIKESITQQEETKMEIEEEINKFDNIKGDSKDQLNQNIIEIERANCDLDEAQENLDFLLNENIHINNNLQILKNIYKFFKEIEFKEFESELNKNNFSESYNFKIYNIVFCEVFNLLNRDNNNNIINELSNFKNNLQNPSLNKYDIKIKEIFKDYNKFLSILENLEFKLNSEKILNFLINFWKLSDNKLDELNKVQKNFIIFIDFSLDCSKTYKDYILRKNKIEKLNLDIEKYKNILAEFEKKRANIYSSNNLEDFQGYLIELEKVSIKIKKNKLILEKLEELSNKLKEINQLNKFILNPIKDYKKANNNNLVIYLSIFIIFINKLPSKLKYSADNILKKWLSLVYIPIPIYELIFNENLWFNILKSDIPFNNNQIINTSILEFLIENNFLTPIVYDPSGYLLKWIKYNHKKDIFYYSNNKENNIKLLQKEIENSNLILIKDPNKEMLDLVIKFIHQKSNLLDFNIVNDILKLNKNDTEKSLKNINLDKTVNIVIFWENNQFNSIPNSILNSSILINNDFNDDENIKENITDIILMNLNPHKRTSIINNHFNNNLRNLIFKKNNVLYEKIYEFLIKKDDINLLKKILEEVNKLIKIMKPKIEKNKNSLHINPVISYKKSFLIKQKNIAHNNSVYLNNDFTSKISIRKKNNSSYNHQTNIKKYSCIINDLNILEKKFEPVVEKIFAIYSILCKIKNYFGDFFFISFNNFEEFILESLDNYDINYLNSTEASRKKYIDSIEISIFKSINNYLPENLQIIFSFFYGIFINIKKYDHNNKIKDLLFNLFLNNDEYYNSDKLENNHINYDYLSFIKKISNIKERLNNFYINKNSPWPKLFKMNFEFLNYIENYKEYFEISNRNIEKKETLNVLSSNKNKKSNKNSLIFQDSNILFKNNLNSPIYNNKSKQNDYLPSIVELNPNFTRKSRFFNNNNNYSNKKLVFGQNSKNKTPKNKFVANSNYNITDKGKFTTNTPIKKNIIEKNNKNNMKNDLVIQNKKDIHKKNYIYIKNIINWKYNIFIQDTNDNFEIDFENFETSIEWNNFVSKRLFKLLNKNDQYFCKLPIKKNILDKLNILEIWLIVKHIRPDFMFLFIKTLIIELKNSHFFVINTNLNVINKRKTNNPILLVFNRNLDLDLGKYLNLMALKNNKSFLRININKKKLEEIQKITLKCISEELWLIIDGCEELDNIYMLNILKILESLLDLKVFITFEINDNPLNYIKLEHLDWVKNLKKIFYNNSNNLQSEILMINLLENDSRDNHININENTKIMNNFKNLRLLFITNINLNYFMFKDKYDIHEFNLIIKQINYCLKFIFGVLRQRGNLLKHILNHNNNKYIYNISYNEINYMIKNILEFYKFFYYPIDGINFIFKYFDLMLNDRNISSINSNYFININWFNNYMNIGNDNKAFYFSKSEYILPNKDASNDFNKIYYNSIENWPIIDNNKIFLINKNHEFLINYKKSIDLIKIFTYKFKKIKFEEDNKRIIFNELLEIFISIDKLSNKYYYLDLNDYYLKILIALDDQKKFKNILTDIFKLIFELVEVFDIKDEELKIIIDFYNLKKQNFSKKNKINISSKSIYNYKKFKKEKSDPNIYIDLIKDPNKNNEFWIFFIINEMKIFNNIIKTLYYDLKPFILKHEIFNKSKFNDYFNNINNNKVPLPWYNLFKKYSIIFNNFNDFIINIIENYEYLYGVKKKIFWLPKCFYLNKAFQPMNLFLNYLLRYSKNNQKNLDKLYFNITKKKNNSNFKISYLKIFGGKISNDYLVKCESREFEFILNDIYFEVQEFKNNYIYTSDNEISIPFIYNNKDNINYIKEFHDYIDLLESNINENKFIFVRNQLKINKNEYIVRLPILLKHEKIEDNQDHEFQYYIYFKSLLSQDYWSLNCSYITFK